MARIIIADDDEIVAELVREALLARGHGAGVVTNGADALRVVKARRPDLLILDCNMPEVSGWWCCASCATPLPCPTCR